MKSDVTQMLNELGSGNAVVRNDLLATLYAELRELARQRISLESPGITLQATALVHEAYLRLLDDKGTTWASRAHFFGAAAEAMRRILIDNARRRTAKKRGKDMVRCPLGDVDIDTVDQFDVLAVNDALTKLEEQNPEAAQVVKLRFFAGLTIKETAALVGCSPRKTDQIWAYAKAWLTTELDE